MTSADDVDVADPEEEDSSPDFREILMAARCAFAVAYLASPQGSHEAPARTAAQDALADVDCLRLVAAEPELVLAAIELTETSTVDAADTVCLAVIERDLADDMAAVVDGLRGGGKHSIGAAVEALLASPSVATVQDVSDDDRIGQLALEDVLLDSPFVEVVATFIATGIADADDDRVVGAVDTAVDAIVDEYVDDPRGIVEALMQVPDVEERLVSGPAGSVVDVATGALRAWMRDTITEAVHQIQLDKPTTTDSDAG